MGEGNAGIGKAKRYRLDGAVSASMRNEKCM
jgi:hypothetical protein